MTTIAPQTAAPLATLQTLQAAAVELAEASTAPATLRAYDSGWRAFLAFCDELDADALPAAPQTVALYVARLVEQGRSSSTVDQRIAAIRFVHRRAGHDSPTQHAIVSAVVQGARRTIGTAPTPKRAFLAQHVRAAVRALDRDSLAGRRDAALLLLGFAGGFRRAEIAALDVTDLEWLDDGLIVMVRQSKTDQTGAGRKVAIPRGRGASCPVAALRDWLGAAGIEGGPVFRSMRKGDRVTDQRLSSKGAALVVKRAAEAIGLDAADFGGHSLRRGLVTSAVRAGRSDAQIMTTTGHRSRAMLDRYREDAGRFDDAASVGLL